MVRCEQHHTALYQAGSCLQVLWVRTPDCTMILGCKIDLLESCLKSPLNCQEWYELLCLIQITVNLCENTEHLVKLICYPNGHVYWLMLLLHKSVSVNKAVRRLNAKSRSLEAARFGVIMIISLRNFTGISQVLRPRCLWHFRAIGKV